MRSAASACSSARTEPCPAYLEGYFSEGKMTTSRIGTIGYQATSAGARSEYSSIILRELFMPAVCKKGEPLKTAVSPLILRRANCKSFPSPVLPPHWQKLSTTRSSSKCLLQRM